MSKPTKKIRIEKLRKDDARSEYEKTKDFLMVLSVWRDARDCKAKVPPWCMQSIDALANHLLGTCWGGPEAGTSPEFLKKLGEFFEQAGASTIPLLDAVRLRNWDIAERVAERLDGKKDKRAVARACRAVADEMNIEESEVSLYFDSREAPEPSREAAHGTVISISSRLPTS